MPRSKDVSLRQNVCVIDAAVADNDDGGDCSGSCGCGRDGQATHVNLSSATAVAVMSMTIKMNR